MPDLDPAADGELIAPDGSYRLTAEQVAAIRAEAVDRGAPQAPTEVDRADGLPGYTERMAAAELLPGGPAVAAARHRLNAAREGGAHPDEVDRLQRELADAAGYDLRDVPAPAEPDVDVRELVAADVLNHRRAQRPQAASNRVLAGLYNDALSVALRLRAALEVSFREDGEEPRPAPPPLRNGNVVVVNGAAWQWRDRQWHPLITADDLAGLPPEQLAVIREHAGDLGAAETGAPRP